MCTYHLHYLHACMHCMTCLRSVKVLITIIMQVDSCEGQADNNFTVQMCASDGSGCLHSNIYSSNIEIMEDNSAIYFMEMTELLPLNHHYITSISVENVIGITNITGLHTSKSMLLACIPYFACG